MISRRFVNVILNNLTPFFWCIKSWESNLTRNVRERALFILSTVPAILRESKVHRRDELLRVQVIPIFIGT